MERKITIEEAGVYREDYQMRILRVNEPEGILPVKGRGIDGNSYYDYYVSGKVSMQAMYERGKIGGEDLKLFLRQFLNTLRETEKYLLNIHCILLKPEYIFYGEERFYFCYYPQAKQDIWEEFHRLTEYFVKQADYEDREGARIVFALHKRTMEENYSIEKTVEDCLGEEESETGGEVGGMYKEAADEKADAKRRPEPEASGYDTSQYDWIHSQKQTNLIMEETDHMWKPVKRFLNRHKKPKWGDWDGLYIEEEEF